MCLVFWELTEHSNAVGHKRSYEMQYLKDKIGIFT